MKAGNGLLGIGRAGKLDKSATLALAVWANEHVDALDSTVRAEHGAEIRLGAGLGDHANKQLAVVTSLLAVGNLHLHWVGHAGKGLLLVQRVNGVECSLAGAEGHKSTSCCTSKGGKKTE